MAAATDHDSHATLVAVRRELARRRLAPATLVEFAAAEPDLGPLAARLAAGRPGALLVLAPSSVAGRLVAAVREAGFRGPILGGATAARAAFRRAAGPAAEGVMAPAPAEPGPAWTGSREPTRRGGRRPPTKRRPSGTTRSGWSRPRVRRAA